MKNLNEMTFEEQVDYWTFHIMSEIVRGNPLRSTVFHLMNCTLNGLNKPKEKKKKC